MSQGIKTTGGSMGLGLDMPSYQVTKSIMFTNLVFCSIFLYSQNFTNLALGIKLYWPIIVVTSVYYVTFHTTFSGPSILLSR